MTRSDPTPRASRWANTLFELAELHDNPRLDELAGTVDVMHVQRGRELTLEEEGRLLTDAAAALQR